jgi:D-alanyl-D-alanine carboxypeptidase (penicillin-binding protein 5/6)
VVGIKTGTTLQAGETLVTQVDRDDHTLIIVVMSSQDRYGETIKIIDWVFNNYEWLQVDPELTKLL